MKYEFINVHNIPAHLDIEKDIQEQQNGNFTFTIRLNNGNIVDYSVVEYVNVPTKYLSRTGALVVQELTIAHNYRKRDTGSQVWDDNL